MTEEQYRKLLAYQTNERLYDDNVQDQDGTAYNLNPLDDSIDYINSLGKKIKVSKAEKPEMYDAMLNELYRYNSVEVFGDTSSIPETEIIPRIIPEEINPRIIPETADEPFYQKPL